MRKMAATALVACMVALVFASIPAVSAAPSEPEPMRCEFTATLISSTDWTGTVTGCDIEGTIQIHETPNNYIVGNVEHFFETFTIMPSQGGAISGVDKGIWDMNTNKFRANGWITGATTEDLSYLVGYKLHESGYVFFSTEITFGGTMFFVES